MEIKTPNTITLAEWPAYYKRAVLELEKKGNGFVSQRQIREFKSCQKGIDEGFMAANELLTQINNDLKLARIINT